MAGIMGKILRVDLGNRQITEEDYAREYVEKYVGADGLAARILYDEVPPGIGALDPENRLVVSAGPFVGTAVQASCTSCFASKAPITGFTIYNSHMNGNFGRLLKFSGYDAIIIQGKAERPVYLWVHNGKAEIRDAAAVWGKDTFETANAIAKEVGEPKLCCASIGPAGENLSLIAGVFSNDERAAARGGLGALMGSKNLKAIAVYGNKKVQIADNEKFAELAKQWREITMANPAVQGFSKYSTSVLTPRIYELGDLPIKNWSRGTLEGWEKLTGQYIVDNMLIKNVTCPSCTVAHRKLLGLKGGAISGEYPMPEYEIVVAMGSNLGVADPTVTAKGGELLARYGLDGLGFSCVVGFAMECYEKGLISKEDTGGLDLRFGNWEAAFEMVEKIAKREGLGAILADGPVSAAEYIGKGSEKLILHAKGMPLPMHDHRSLWGYALQYAVGSTAAGHEGGPFGAEQSGALGPRFSTKGKAKAVLAGQEGRCFLNTLGICVLASGGVTPDMMAQTLSAATGIDYSADDTRTIARRLLNLRRAFNIRHGLVPEDDTLPYRYLNDPAPDGGAKGITVPVKPMVRDYYNIMGWDLKTGKPYRKTLVGLGLEDVAEDLWG